MGVSIVAMSWYYKTPKFEFKHPHKASSKLTAPPSMGFGTLTSGYSSLLGMFHTLKMTSMSSKSLIMDQY